MSAADRLSLLALKAFHPPLYMAPTFGLEPGEGKAGNAQFTLFPLLPWELRQQIWCFCVSPDSDYTRAFIVRLRQYIFARDGYSYSTGYRGCTNKMYNLRNYMKYGPSPYALLYACHESRLVAFELVKNALENETWMKEWLLNIGGTFGASLSIVKRRDKKEERSKAKLVEKRRIPTELLVEKCSLVYKIERLNPNPILLEQFIFWSWKNRTLVREEREMLLALKAAEVHLGIRRNPEHSSAPPQKPYQHLRNPPNPSKLTHAIRSFRISMGVRLRGLAKKLHMSA